MRRISRIYVQPNRMQDAVEYGPLIWFNVFYLFWPLLLLELIIVFFIEAIKNALMILVFLISIVVGVVNVFRDFRTDRPPIPRYVRDSYEWAHRDRR